VDFAVGFSELKKAGERVEKGEPLCLIHARSEAALSAILPMLVSGFDIS
jgi:thymidine phosphorylase